MALTMNNGDLINVRMVFQVDAQGNALNVLHYQIGSVSGTPPTVNIGLPALCQAVYDHFEAQWSQISSTQTSFRLVVANSVFPLPRSVGWNYTPSTPTAGEVTGQALPGQDAPTVIKRTNFGDKGGIGRVYVVGGAETYHENGRIVPVAQPLYEAYATLFDDTLLVTGTGWSFSAQPVIVKGPEDNPVRIAQVVKTEMSTYDFKTMRRRRPGKGI